MRGRRRRGGGWVLGALPLAVLVLAIGALPFLVALRDSFRHDVYGEVRPAGLDNYEFIARDRAFLASLGLTVAWAFLEAALATALGWRLALFLHEAKRGRRLAYAALLVPWGVPAYIAVPIWRMLLHGAGGTSVFTALFGLRIDLLTDPAAGFLSALFVGAWMGAPGAAFVLYGALRKLPRNAVEAARLDGAGPAAVQRHIYRPLVAASLVTVFAFEFVKAFKEFQVPFLLTAGGPPLVAGITERSILGATTTLEIYLYDLFQASPDYGLSAAYATVTGGLVALLTAFAFLASRLAGKGKGKSGTGLPGRGGAFAQGRILDGAELAVRGVVVAFFALSCILVLFALVRVSFSGLSTTLVDSFLPRFPTASNYGEIFRQDGAGRAFANTVLVSLVTAALAPLLVFPAALAMRRAGPGARAAVFALLQALGSAGGMHSLVPLFSMFRALGLVGSYAPVVLVYLFHAAPFALFATTAFLDSLPRSLEECAEIEGAGRARIVASVLLPLSLPVLATTAMTAFLAAWNGFLVPLLFLTDDSKYTIGVRLYSYVGSVASGAPEWNRFGAASVVNLALTGFFLWRCRNPLGDESASQGPD